MRSSSMPLWRPRESRGTCSRSRIASRRRQAPGVALPGAGALPDGVGLAGLVVVATFRFRVSREVIGSRSDAAISALFGFFLLTVAINPRGARAIRVSRVKAMRTAEPIATLRARALTTFGYVSERQYGMYDYAGSVEVNARP